jgi:lipopolysaccharide transport system ATP-binding protein
MYVRLAFAVAAHLEPEILLMDEVLAVGDAAFQQKCLGKMKDVVRDGRTVLFVSHNMPAVLNLCGRALLLERGRVVVDGETDVVVSRYLRQLRDNEGVSVSERTDREGNQVLRFVDIEFLDDRGLPVRRVQCGQHVTFALRYEGQDGRALRNIRAGITIHGRFDENLFNCANDISGFPLDLVPASGTLLCTIPNLPLQPGTYSFNIFCEVGGEVADWVKNAGSLEVCQGDFFGSGKLPELEVGSLLIHNKWRVTTAEENLAAR